MNRIFLSTLITAAALLIVIPMQAAESLPWPDTAIEGTFETRVCASSKQWGTGALAESVRFFRRSYTFEDGHSTSRYTFFADENCQKPLFTAIWVMTYKLGKASPHVPTARELDARVLSQHLMILAPEALALTRDCGKVPWVVGIERDASKDGCIGAGLMFAPITASSADFDIIDVNQRRLMVGFRTPDMRESPTARPTRLQLTLPALRL